MEEEHDDDEIVAAVAESEASDVRESPSTENWALARFRVQAATPPLAGSTPEAHAAEVASEFGRRSRRCARQRHL